MRRQASSSTTTSAILPPVSLVFWRTVTQGRYLLWQRSCENYAPPPDRLVYDDQPAPSWFTNSRDHDNPLLQPVSDSGTSPGLTFPLSPTQRRADPVLPETPFTSGSAVGPGAIFMHAVRGRNGVRRLASVNAVCYDAIPDGYVLVLGANTWDPASAFPGSTMQRYDFPCAGLVVPNGKRLQIFAGQRDPADESHFTIPYSLGGAPGTIGGTFFDETSSGFLLAVCSGPVRLIQPYRPAIPK